MIKWGYNQSSNGERDYPIVSNDETLVLAASTGNGLQHYLDQLISLNWATPCSPTEQFLNGGAENLLCGLCRRAARGGNAADVSSNRWRKRGESWALPFWCCWHVLRKQVVLDCAKCWTLRSRPTNGAALLFPAVPSPTNTSLNVASALQEQQRPTQRPFLFSLHFPFSTFHFCWSIFNSICSTISHFLLTIFLLFLSFLLLPLLLLYISFSPLFLLLTPSFRRVLSN